MNNSENLQERPSGWRQLALIGALLLLVAIPGVWLLW
jgi:hypothetical protein